MSEKTYLSGARLSLYDEKLKAKMATDDSVTLGSAKTYTDEELAAFGTEVDEALGALASAVNGKAPATHNHKISDVTNLQSELDGKSDAGHTHTIDSALSTTSTNPVQNKIVNEAIQDAKAYTDTKTSGLASTSSLTSTVNTHNTSTSSHSDIRLDLSEINTKLNNFLNVNDTTKDQLSEVIALIEANANTIADITSNKVNVSDIIDNLTTNVSNKPLSAAQGVALKVLVDALESDKADSDHSHHNATTTTSGLMSSEDKEKLDNVEPNATNNKIVIVRW